MGKDKKINQPKILMYHGTIAGYTPSFKNREVGAEIYDLSVDQFRLQMEYLKDNKYNILTLQNGLHSFSDGDVIITFDDGEMNNYEYAYPILKELGFKAYFFVTAKNVGKEGYMGVRELQEMIEGGMIVGSHGLSHEIMTNLLDTQIEEELRASKKFLERNLDTPIDDFSVPRGFSNDKIIQMAYEQGYKNIFISQRSRRISKECYSRLGVRKHWSLKRFEQGLNDQVPLREIITHKCKSAAKLILREGGYNWVRQTIIKVLK